LGLHLLYRFHITREIGPDLSNREKRYDLYLLTGCGGKQKTYQEQAKAINAANGIFCPKCSRFKIKLNWENDLYLILLAETPHQNRS
jgi:hypothetical protein